MRPNNTILSATILSLISLPSVDSEAKIKQKPANVLLILADDCSYYDIGCFGSKNTETPNIDNLAEEGIIFNRAYNSSAMSTPTRHSLYTGLFPIKHGGYANHSRVKDGVKSMPHYLEKLGYRVGIAGKLHIKPLENFPFEMVPGFVENCVSKDPSYTTDGIEEFMSRNSEQPFCLVLASINPHMPSTGGDLSKFDRKKLVLPPYFADTEITRERYARYLAEVELLDKEVGDAVAILKKHNVYENTLVIFMSEQGSQFAGAKWTNWSAGVKSAMIASWPERIKSNSKTNAVVQYEDVLPTIIDLAGGKKEKGMDGVSFLQVLDGKSDKHRKFAYHAHNNIPEGPAFPIRSISDGKYRLIWNLSYQKPYREKHIEGADWFKSWKESQNEDAKFAVNRFKNRPEFELYDIENDVNEFNNLAVNPGYQKILNQLKSELFSWMKSQGDLGIEMDKPVKKSE